mmetsp:Transcript_12918/g.27439  ORF Transcript_12918/g.27439 Transcript_12918/m.27439 type:complete len:111 (-) Transcript_12918:490-822(-)
MIFDELPSSFLTCSSCMSCRCAICFGRRPGIKECLERRPPAGIEHDRFHGLASFRTHVGLTSWPLLGGALDSSDKISRRLRPCRQLSWYGGTKAFLELGWTAQKPARNLT